MACAPVSFMPLCQLEIRFTLSLCQPLAHSHMLYAQAEEFGTNGQARAMFLSQSCPTWGAGFSSFPARADTSNASEVTCAFSLILGRLV